MSFLKYASMRNYIKSMLRSMYKNSVLSTDGRKCRKIIHAGMEHIAPFHKALKQFSNGKPDRAMMIIESYKDKRVKTADSEMSGKLTEAVKNIKPCEPVLLCITKDDCEKVKAQVEYHRQLGLKYFAYIDNMSSDGTVQWLRKQDDVLLFTVDEQFHDDKKVSWKRQVMDILGYDRWYLILDQDEMFCYPGAPQIKIQSYIAHLEKQGLTAAFAPLLDMYSDKALFTMEGERNLFTDEYCFFDTDTYKIVNKYRSLSVKGGPRTRIFNIPWELIKYPLFFARKDTISPSHRNFPRKHNISRKKPMAYLLHYKCLPSDYRKYKDFAQGKTETEHFREVPKYDKMMEAFEDNPNLSFYREGSQRLDSSIDLLQINIGDKEFFNSLLSAHTR